MFVPGKFFQAGLIFWGMASTYSSVRPGCDVLAVTNTLAYFTGMSVLKKYFLGAPIEAIVNVFHR